MREVCGDLVGFFWFRLNPSLWMSSSPDTRGTLVLHAAGPVGAAPPLLAPGELLVADRLASNSFFVPRVGRNIVIPDFLVRPVFSKKRRFDGISVWRKRAVRSARRVQVALPEAVAP